MSEPGARIVVLTALFGQRDTLLEPTLVNPACRYVCFTDRDFVSPTWDVIRVAPFHESKRRSARAFKLITHEFLDAEYSLWVDATVEIGVDPEQFLERHLTHADIATFGHPWRDCVYDEIVACTKMGLDDPRALAAQASRYLEDGLPRHAGLFETGVLARRHSPRMRDFDEFWWDEYVRGSNRDQVSFGYCVWREAMVVQVIPGNVRKSTEFRFAGHSGPRLGRFDERPEVVNATVEELAEIERARTYVLSLVQTP